MRDARDTVSEDANAGTDTVQASVTFTLSDNVERLVLTGTDAIDGTGNGEKNILSGNGAANVLDGKLGDDALYGRGGADTFAFTTALGPERNADRIAGFDADDLIRLDHAVFAELAVGDLAESAFKVYTAPGAKIDADDRILYSQTSGYLCYDADGSGRDSRPVLFAALDKGTVLTFDQFEIV